MEKLGHCTKQYYLDCSEQYPLISCAMLQLWLPKDDGSLLCPPLLRGGV